MKILHRREDLNIQVTPGDTLNLWYEDPETGKATLVASETIREAQKIDTAIVIQTEDGELGLEWGIGGVFGRKKRRKKR